MASRKNLKTLFCWMFRRDKKRMNIPSRFKVFDFDKMRF